MARYNTVQPSRGATSPLKSVFDPAVRTYGGGPAAVPDSKTELFKLAVNLFAGDEKTFYEKGQMRDKRFTSLIETIAVSDPTWMFGFLNWLRREGNIRTASIIGAAHAIHARLKNANSISEDELLSSLGMTGINRALVVAVCSRADEPGEFVAYWKSKFGPLPKAVKRGLADAVRNLYNEYAVMKYDTASHGVRFADVLNLTHAKAEPIKTQAVDQVEGNRTYRKYNQASLFKYIIDRRYNLVTDINDYELPTIAANALIRETFKSDPKVLLDAKYVKNAGLTWEDVLSLAGTKLPKAQVWEAIIPSMGYMAILRNLRNFEEAGISKEMTDYVISKLTDPAQVARSRQFPFRFLSAFDNVNSLKFKAALEEALEHSVKNVPVLDGRTLVLVDTSGSMSTTVSNFSKMSRAGIAALFGGAFANANAGNVDLVMFADRSMALNVPKGGSVLTLADNINKMNGRVGHGTQTAQAVKDNFKAGVHKRVIIFTDMQSFNFSGYSRSYYIGAGYGSYSTVRSLGDLVPKDVFMYAFNLAGYKNGDLETGEGRRYQLAGLTDSTFKMIPLLEAGQTAKWPWEAK